MWVGEITALFRPGQASKENAIVQAGVRLAFQKESATCELSRIVSDRMETTDLKSRAIRGVRSGLNGFHTLLLNKCISLSTLYK